MFNIINSYRNSMSIFNKSLIIFSLALISPAVCTATPIDPQIAEPLLNDSKDANNNPESQEEKTLQPNKDSLERIAFVKQKYDQKINQTKNKLASLEEERTKQIEQIYQRQHDLEAFIATGTCIGCDLSGFDLSQIIIAHNKNNTPINVSRSNLSNSVIIKGDLSKAKFEETILDNAIISESLLRQANFKRASIKGTDLSKSDLKHLLLDGIVFDHNTNLSGTSIDEIIITNSLIRTKLQALHTMCTIFRS